jgi:hypothetical protein
MNSLKATDFLLILSSREKVRMGVEMLIVFMLSFYSLPSPPPARGRE